MKGPIGDPDVLFYSACQIKHGGRPARRLQGDGGHAAEHGTEGNQDGPVAGTMGGARGLGTAWAQRNLPDPIGGEAGLRAGAARGAGEAAPVVALFDRLAEAGLAGQLWDSWPPMRCESVWTRRLNPDGDLPARWMLPRRSFSAAVSIRYSAGSQTRCMVTPMPQYNRIVCSWPLLTSR